MRFCSALLKKNPPLYSVIDQSKLCNTQRCEQAMPPKYDRAGGSLVDTKSDFARVIEVRSPRSDLEHFNVRQKYYEALLLLYSRTSRPKKDRKETGAQRAESTSFREQWRTPSSNYWSYLYGSSGFRGSPVVSSDLPEFGRFRGVGFRHCFRSSWMLVCSISRRLSALP